MPTEKKDDSLLDKGRLLHKIKSYKLGTTDYEQISNYPTSS